MKIETNRFLALTMALATGAMAATGCVVTDDDPADTENVTDDGGAGNVGGSAGEEGVEPVAGAASGGASNAGAAPVAGAAIEGGAAVVTEGAATEGGAAVSTGGAVIEGGAAAVAGGTTEGGAAVVGGATTEGGAAVVVGGAANGGAAVVAGGAANGGAAGAGGGDECLGDASVELDCYSTMPMTSCAETDPSYEGYYPNPVLEACYSVGSLLGEIQAAIFDCLLTIEGDPCSTEAAAAIAACEQEDIGQACENPLAVTACADGYTDEWDQAHAAILTSCDDGTLDQASCVAALNPRVDYGYVADCMDPNDPSEEIYDPSFTGDCAARLVSCRGY